MLQRRFRAAITAVLVLHIACADRSAEPDSTPTVATSPTVARIEGEEIDLATLDSFLKEELLHQATQGKDPMALYRAREGALWRLIDQRLLERESVRHGVDVATLLARKEAELAPISDADIEAFYAAHAAGNGRETLPEDTARVRRVLQKRRRNEIVRSIRERAEIEIALASPHERLASGRPSIGPAAAPVTLIVFTDYASLDSARADALVDQLARAYPEGLRIVHRTLSRERSSFYNSRGGAEAAICGDRLGSFRKLHELLLKNQRSLTPDALAEYAAAAGLDRARFGECLGEPETRDRLAADVAALNQLGITEAPAYLINGRLVQGSKPLPVLMGLIEAERRRHRL